MPFPFNPDPKNRKRSKVVKRLTSKPSLYLLLLKRFYTVKKLSLIIFITSIVITSFGQTRKEKKEAKRQKINEMVRQAEEGVLVYQKQSIFGIQLRTNGYGGFYEMAKRKTNRKANVYRIDFTEIKHTKEEKLLGGSFVFGNPYVYGKINNFYQVTLGFGQQYILGQKGNKNGVAVGAVYTAGFRLGLLRPYYLHVDDPASGGEKTIKYSEEDSALFMDQSAIISGGGFGKGWNELRLKPGGFLKAECDLIMDDIMNQFPVWKLE